MLEAVHGAWRGAGVARIRAAQAVISSGAPRSPASGVSAAGCALAVCIGAAASTGDGLLIPVVFGAAVFGAGAVALYLRDPVLAFIWLWLFEIFNAPLSAALGYFSPAGEAVRQADELLVLLFLALTVVRMALSNARIPPLGIIISGLGFAVFGTLSAIEHEVPLGIASVGAWLALKLWLSLLVALSLPWKRSDQRRVYLALSGVGLAVAVIGLLDYLTHAAISRALHTSIYRFSSGTARGEAVHSIFPHPGEFSLFMSLLFAFAFTRFASKRHGVDLVLALCFAASIILSLRLKGFLALGAVVAIVGMSRGVSAGRGSMAIAFVGVVLLLGAYGVEGSVISTQLKTYTSSETSARARLYTAGNQLALENFPLGVGFGRFATYISRLHYSPVYRELGLNRVWGLSRQFPGFIDDTSWPGVIGEAGYGGLACYLAGLVLLIAALVRRLRSASADEQWLPLAALAALAAFLVDSLGDPTLFDWLATTSLALIVGPALLLRTARVPSRAALECERARPRHDSARVASTQNGIPA